MTIGRPLQQIPSANSVIPVTGSFPPYARLRGSRVNSGRIIESLRWYSRCDSCVRKSSGRVDELGSEELVPGHFGRMLMKIKRLCLTGTVELLD